MTTKEPNKEITRLDEIIKELLKHPNFDKDQFYRWIDTIAKMQFQSIYINSGRFDGLTKENFLLAVELNERYEFINPELIKEFTQ